MLASKYTEPLEAAFVSDNAGKVFSDDRLVIEATDKGSVHVIYTGTDDAFWREILQYCDRNFGSVAVGLSGNSRELWFPRH